jgi:hypothetical protein
MFYNLLHFLGLTASPSSPHCKSTPSSPSWPSPTLWSALNVSLSGNLIHPSPPGAVCHPSHASHNPSLCPSVQAGWKTSAWHTENPVSTINDNWNNDTCLPIASAPCSGVGYPVYVINATSAGDVKKGVDFAREHDIRIVVKGTGHDYLGRCVTPSYFLLLAKLKQINSPELPLNLDPSHTRSCFSRRLHTSRLQLINQRPRHNRSSRNPNA